MRWSLVAVLLAAFLIPAAPVVAGTPDEPDLVDAAGDQSVPAPLGTGLDLLAAWVQPTGRDDLTVTLRLAEISDTTQGTYEVIWGMTAPLNPGVVTERGGVRIRLGSTPEGFVLTGAATGAMETYNLDVEVTVRNGAPGEVDATFAIDDVLHLAGATLQEFTATATPSLDLLPITLGSGTGAADTATGDGVVSIAGIFHADPNLAPVPGRELTSPENQGLPGAIDLRHVTFGMDGQDAVITYELRSLTTASLRDCSGWRLSSFTFDGDGDGLSATVSTTFEGGWVDRLFFYVRKDEGNKGGSVSTELPAQLTVRLGSPGFAQVRVLGAGTDVAFEDAEYGRASATCDDGNGSTREDSIDVDKAFIPGPSLWLLAVALAGTALFVRRRRA